jgi:hypothetical protein
MRSAPLRRGFLTTLIVLSAACDDLSLRGRAETPVADTAPNPGDARKTRRRSTAKVDRNDPQTEAGSFAEIKRSLRHLVAAEESFFAENGTYTEDLSVIRFSPSKNVTTRFLWLSRDGWAASGTHTALPDRDCVIFVGQGQSPPTTLKYVRSGREGVPVCDDRGSVPPKVATAPPPTSPPPPADTVSTLDLLDPRVSMKVDLRNLAHSQETYHAMQGFYARRTSNLALQYLWHRYVKVNILEADAQSWAARATHARHPGKSCVIWFGDVSQRPRTDAQRKAANSSGVPVCDD